MRIDAPRVRKLTFQAGAAATESAFTGSFTGSFIGAMTPANNLFTGTTEGFTALQSNISASFAVSSSAHSQRTSISGALASTIAGLDASGYATDAELSTLSGSSHTDRIAKITVLSGSAHTDRVAKIAILSASVDAHLDANISALSSSVDTHLDANIAALSASAHSQRVSEDTVLSGSAHTQRVALNTAQGSANSTLSSSLDTRIKVSEGFKTNFDTAIGLSSDDVTILGNLTIQGDTTTLNTATLDVEDLNITVAKNAASAASANGAGLTVDGASATLTYASTGDKWAFNKDVDLGSNNLITAGNVDGRDVSADGTKLDGIEALADVTDTTNVTAAGALMDSEVDADIKTLSLPANTTISTFGKSLVDDADAATARTTLELEEVTNESKLTMFASPTFSGTVSGVTATHVGLGNVDNTSDADKPVSTAQQTEIDTKLDITDALVNVGGFNQLTFKDQAGRINGTSNFTIDPFSFDLTHAGGLASFDGGLDVNGALFTVNTSGDTKADSLGVGTAASGTTGEIRATGDITAYYSSDERLKENIEPLSAILNKLLQVGVYSYDWKEGISEITSKTGSDIGVIAQEVKEIFPELVEERDNGYLAVDYLKFTSLIISAFKELVSKQNVLKEHTQFCMKAIEELKEENESLKK
jgi:hypothetical protein